MNETQSLQDMMKGLLSQYPKDVLLSAVQSAENDEKLTEKMLIRMQPAHKQFIENMAEINRISQNDVVLSALSVYKEEQDKVFHTMLHSVVDGMQRGIVKNYAEKLDILAESLFPVINDNEPMWSFAASSLFKLTVHLMVQYVNEYTDTLMRNNSDVERVWAFKDYAYTWSCINLCAVYNAFQKVTACKVIGFTSGNSDYLMKWADAVVREHNQSPTEITALIVDEYNTFNSVCTDEKMRASVYGIFVTVMSRFDTERNRATRGYIDFVKVAMKKSEAF